MPEILAASGSRLVEVGTTNRTRLADYARACGPEAGAILRVHPSNFRQLGFTEEAPLAELAGLARERGLALIDDLGSGALGPDAIFGDEPDARASVAAGCDLACFSADKLLGGPQAGILVGTEEAVARVKAHPLMRALRLDKLRLAALEATLALHRDPALARARIPALAMLAGDPERAPPARRGARGGRRRRGGAHGRPGRRRRAAAGRAAELRGRAARPARRARRPPADRGAGRAPAASTRGACCWTCSRCRTPTGRSCRRSSRAPGSDERGRSRSARPGTSTTARPPWCAR